MPAWPWPQMVSPRIQSVRGTQFLQVSLIEIVGDKSTIQTHGGFYLIAHPHKPSLGHERVVLCPEPAFDLARGATSQALSFVWGLGHKFEMNSGSLMAPAELRKSGGAPGDGGRMGQGPGGPAVKESGRRPKPPILPGNTQLLDQSFNVRTFAPGGGISCPADFMAVTCWMISKVSPGWRSAV